MSNNGKFGTDCTHPWGSDCGQEARIDPDDFVKKIGDTMTGNLALPTTMKSIENALRKDEVQKIVDDKQKLIQLTNNNDGTYTLSTDTITQIIDTTAGSNPFDNNNTASISGGMTSTNVEDAITELWSSIPRDVEDLDNVAINLIQESDILRYRNGRWINESIGSMLPPAGGGGGAPGPHSHNMADINGLDTALRGKLSLITVTAQTMAGSLILNGAPTADLGAATKKYVDDTIAAAAPGVHTHAIADVTNLQTELDKKLPKTGGTMTGALILDDAPSVVLGAATKGYVDGNFSQKNTYTGPVDLDKAPKLTGNGYLDWSFLNGHPLDFKGTFDPSVKDGDHSSGNPVTDTEPSWNEGDVLIANNKGLYNSVTGDIGAGENIDVGDWYVFEGGTRGWVAIATKSITETKFIWRDGSHPPTADFPMVNYKITNLGAPINNNDATTKKYVDDADKLKADKNHTHAIGNITNLQTTLNGKLPIAGGTMTGSLILDDGPTVDLGAATKKYVDDMIAAGGGTGGGGTAPAKHTHLISEVVNLQTTLDKKLSLSGGVMTGSLVLDAAPTSDLGATNKKYVDDKLSQKNTYTGAVDSNKAPKLTNNGYLDWTFLNGNPLDFRGTFDPTVKDGGHSSGNPVRNTDPNWSEGDVLIANKKGTYDSSTGAIGSGDAIDVGDWFVFEGGTRGWVAIATKNIEESKFTWRDGSHPPSADFPMANNKITGLKKPTNNSDAATKKYVDDADRLRATSIHTHTIANVTGLQPALDGKLALTGGTLTGALVLGGAPTTDLGAATKKYVDDKLTSGIAAPAQHSHVIADVTGLQTLLDGLQNSVDQKVSLTGDTMTGALILDAAPTTNLGAATKKYVDDKLSQKNTQTGPVDSNKAPKLTGNGYLDWSYLNGHPLDFKGTFDPTVANGDHSSTNPVTNTDPNWIEGDVLIANKKGTYNSTNGAIGSGDAIDVGDWLVYEGGTRGWVPIATKNIEEAKLVWRDGSHPPSADFPMANHKITNLKTPTGNADATTKKYVDDADNLKANKTHTHTIANVTGLQTALDAKFLKAGGVLSGTLTLNGAPTANLHAATKKYVDDELAKAAIAAGGTAPIKHSHAIGDVTGLQPALDGKLALTGGTLTGALILDAAPTVNLGAATKKYVDDKLSRKNTYTGPVDSNKAPKLTTSGYLDWSYLNGHPLDFKGTFDPTVTNGNHSSNNPVTNGETSWNEGDILIANKKGTYNPTTGATGSGDAIDVGDWYVFEGGTRGWVVIETKAVDGNQFIWRDGSHPPTTDLPMGNHKITGLKVPTGNADATTKKYVDDTIANAAPKAHTHTIANVTGLQAELDKKLPKSGGTLTGALTLKADPTTNLHAATKRYVDSHDALKLPLNGGTMTGPLVLEGAPTADLQAATKKYVDDKQVVLDYASDAEVLAGTVVDKVISPKGLQSRITQTGPSPSVNNFTIQTSSGGAGAYILVKGGPATTNYTLDLSVTRQKRGVSKPGGGLYGPETINLTSIGTPRKPKITVTAGMTKFDLAEAIKDVIVSWLPNYFENPKINATQREKVEFRMARFLYQSGGYLRYADVIFQGAALKFNKGANPSGVAYENKIPVLNRLGKLDPTVLPFDQSGGVPGAHQHKMGDVYGLDDELISINSKVDDLYPIRVERKIADYTLKETDEKKYLRFDSVSGVLATVPPDGANPLVIGSVFNLVQAGVGNLTLVAGAGVTLNTPHTLSSAKQFAHIKLIKVGPNEWDVSGELAP